MSNLCGNSWTLLVGQCCTRPIAGWSDDIGTRCTDGSHAGRLEAMEGKSMAIDSSIWIYHFQATMRDKEGRGLVNAHVVGFLRRICKLLFYGIKPVFVFDGGAPALKMSTIVRAFSFWFDQFL